jgi:RHS repeat-associated protein
VTKTETINGTTTTWAYGYDVAGRLSDVLKDGAVYAHYDYDANGNRLDKTNGAGTVLAAGTYDNQDRMLTYGSNSYAYTANGELTAKTDTTTGKVTSYTYDVLGNLKHVNLPDGTAIDYVIDGRNRRIGKKVNGTLTEAYLYDGQLRPIAELDASGNVVSRFIYATHINVPDYMIKGGVTYKIITDHLGSPRFIIDSSSGAIAQRMDYDDFGNVLLDTAPGFTPFGFAGGIYDYQTKLVRFGARDYDPETGRWTSKDPLGYGARTLSLFSYCHHDPVNYHDTTGKEPISGALMGAFWGVYGAYMHGGDLGDALVGGLAGAATGALLGLLDPTSVLAGAALAAMAAGAGNAAAQGVDILRDPCRDFNLEEMGGTMLGGFAGGAMGAAYVGATGLEGAAAQVAGDAVGGAVGLGVESPFVPFGE